jgi:hypothetical protein
MIEPSPRAASSASGDLLRDLQLVDEYERVDEETGQCAVALGDDRRLAVESDR